MYGPVLKVLDERKKKIADSLKNAEEIEKRLLEIGELQEKEIQKATKIGEQIIKDATISATQLYKDTKVKAHSLSEKFVKEAQIQLQMEKGELVQSVRENIAELVFTVVQKVTGKVLTKQDRQRIAEEAIKGLKS